MQLRVPTIDLQNSMERAICKLQFDVGTIMHRLETMNTQSAQRRDGGGGGSNWLDGNQQYQSQFGNGGGGRLHRPDLPGSANQQQHGGSAPLSVQEFLQKLEPVVQALKAGGDAASILGDKNKSLQAELDRVTERLNTMVRSTQVRKNRGRTGEKQGGVISKAPLP